MSALEDRIRSATPANFAVLGLILAGLYYMQFYDGGEKLNNTIKAKNAELQKEQKDLQDIESLVADFDRYQNEINQLSEKFEVALKYLPSEENVYVIIKQLYLEAKRAGVNITLVKPAEQNIAKDFYEEMPFDIEVEGGYIQLLNFLSQVVNVPRVINLKKVELNAKKSTKANSSPVIELKGVMYAYRYNDKAKQAIEGSP